MRLWKCHGGSSYKVIDIFNEKKNEMLGWIRKPIPAPQYFPSNKYIQHVDCRQRKIYVTINARFGWIKSSYYGSIT